MDSNYSVKKIDAPEELEKIIGLIQNYQEFYLKKPQTKEAIFLHFKQLLSTPALGFQATAWNDKKSALGFCTVLFLPSSLSCRNYAYLSDLFVCGDVRRSGIGRALIRFASQESKQLGLEGLEWITQQDNLLAQKLYDKLTPNKSLWYCYSLKT